MVGLKVFDRRVSLGSEDAVNRDVIVEFGFQQMLSGAHFIPGGIQTDRRSLDQRGPGVGTDDAVR